MLETVFSEILADSSFAVFAVLASEQFHMVKTVFLKSATQHVRIVSETMADI